MEDANLPHVDQVVTSTHECCIRKVLVQAMTFLWISKTQSLKIRSFLSTDLYGSRLLSSERGDLSQRFSDQLGWHLCQGSKRRMGMEKLAKAWQNEAAKRLSSGGSPVGSSRSSRPRSWHFAQAPFEHFVTARIHVVQLLSQSALSSKVSRKQLS